MAFQIPVITTCAHSEFCVSEFCVFRKGACVIFQSKTVHTIRSLSTAIVTVHTCVYVNVSLTKNKEWVTVIAIEYTRTLSTKNFFLLLYYLEIHIRIIINKMLTIIIHICILLVWVVLYIRIIIIKMRTRIIYIFIILVWVVLCIQNIIFKIHTSLSSNVHTPSVR